MEPRTPPTAFAAAVRAARGPDRANLTQADLATEIGVTVSTVYRVERGLTPSLEVEVKLRRWAAKWGGLPLLDAPASTGTDG